MVREDESMKIAISGSHGLIGSELATRLTNDGHQVIHLVRKASESPSEIFWDQNGEGENLVCLEGVDAVVHLAGENISSGRWTDEKKKEIRESRVRSTKQLSKALAALQNPPKVFICGSAIGFYGERGDTIVDESASGGFDFLSEVCKDWENATEAAKKAGIRVVNLRTGVVLSKRGGALAKMLPPIMSGLGGPLGDGRQYMSWISMDDEVGAIIHILNTESLSGPVNLVAPHAVTNKEFTSTLGNVVHRPTVFPVPAFGLRLLLGEMADELLLSSTLVKPTKLEQSGYKFRYPELEAALKHALTH